MSWSLSRLSALVLCGLALGSLLITLLGAWAQPIILLVVAHLAPVAVILACVALIRQSPNTLDKDNTLEIDRSTAKVTPLELQSERVFDSAKITKIQAQEDIGHHSSDLHLIQHHTDSTSPQVVEDRGEQLEALREALKRVSGIMVYQISKKVNFVSGGLQDLVGYSLKEIDVLQDGIASLEHPDDRQRDRDLEKAWIDGGAEDVLIRVSRFRHKDGHWVWLEDRMVGQLDEDGKLSEKSGITVNVSREIEAKEEARVAGQRAEMALHASSFGVWTHDLTNNRLEQDDQCLAMLGFERNETTESLEYWRTRTHPDDLEKVAGQYERMLKGEAEGYESTVRVLNGKNQYKHIHTMARLIEGEDPEKSKIVVGIVRDVSEQVLREKVLQESQRMESLGMLAGGIAHDFNNYLSAILGYASLAMATLPAGSDVSRHLHNVVSGAERATDLTKQLLAYSGSSSTSIEALDLSESANSIASLMQVTISSKVKLDIVAEQNLPTVLGDETQIQQVILNLITNASEAIGNNDGRIQVRVSAKEVPIANQIEWRIASDEKHTRFVCLEVKDDGSGMSPETLDRLFDPFFTTKKSGHGLGLAALTGIVRAHHGAIDISTKVGEGTSFNVYFPARDVERPPSRKPSGKLVKTDRWTILVADDDEMIRTFVEDFLTASGHQAIMAVNGKEAVELVRQNADLFDLILMDLTMPVMDGFEATKVIGEIAPELPIILSSGYRESDSIAELFENPRRTFLQKPYLPDSLLKQIDRAISAANA